MLKQFTCKNYRNFRDPIVVDFGSTGGYQFNTDCITDGTIGKMLIYGRNATGKTNLGRAVMDITTVLLGKVVKAPEVSRSLFLHGDADCDHAEFDYLFQFDGTAVKYQYGKYAPFACKFERLLLDGRTVFDFDYANGVYHHDGLGLIGAETILAQRFLADLEGRLSADEDTGADQFFLGRLFSHASFPESSPMEKLRTFISKMHGFNVSEQTNLFRPATSKFYQSLVGDNLRRLEDFLNAMGVSCRLESKILPDGTNELYFCHARPVPFYQTASSGTLSLFHLYRRVVAGIKDLSFLYLDEFDAFFHFEMSERFLRYLKETFPRCQIILTTHNTNLMTNRLMRPDCIFILTQAGQLTPLNQATPRELREGHNLEKLYMSGEFDE